MAPLPLLREILGSSDAPASLLRAAVAAYAQAGGDPARLLDGRALLRDPQLLEVVLAALPRARAEALLAALPPEARARLGAAAPPGAAAGPGGAGGAGGAGDRAAADLATAFPGLRPEDARRLLAAGADLPAVRSLVEAGLAEFRAARRGALSALPRARNAEGAGEHPGSLSPAAPPDVTRAAASGLALAFAGLAALLRAGSKDGPMLIEEALGPLGGHPFVAVEDRGERAPDEGASEKALELMAAMRSLDFAGLKAVALDRAARRAAELRLSLAIDPEAGGRLARVLETMALLLASDPAGIARFGREHAELFPPAAARGALAELLRTDAATVRAALAACASHLLRTATAAEAFGAGWLAGAATAGAAVLAPHDAAPARRAAVTFDAALDLAASLGTPAGGAPERDGAARILDAARAAVEAALARADAGQGGYPLETAHLARSLEARLLDRAAALDPDGQVGLAGEVAAGFALFRTRG